MHIRRGALGWGVFLILAGAIPLAVRAGILDEGQVSELWTLWPMILIGLGIGLLLGRSRFAFVGGLIVAATLGLMIGGLLSAGLGGAGNVSAGACGDPAHGRSFPDVSGSFAATGVTVELAANCGDVTIGTIAGATWAITGRDWDGDGPELEAGPDALTIRSTDGGGPLGIFSARSTIAIDLPSDPRLDLDFELNGGSTSLDLAGAALGSTRLGFNAGTTNVDLGAVREIRDIQVELNAGTAGITLPALSLTGAIEANAGSVRLCVPDGIGLRLQTGDSIAASFDYGDHGLVQDGSTWTTPGFDDAAVRIELRTSGNAASFTLDPAEGCHG